MSGLKRVTIGGIMHESNTFASTPTNLTRFKEASLTFGQDLVDYWAPAHHEIGGMIEGTTALGLDLLPSVMAWATPSGPVTDDVIDLVVERLNADISTGAVDGLLLSLHGAMVSDRHLQADEEVIKRIRQHVGPAFPIVTTLDFHANVSPGMGRLTQGLVGYQTYPHIDQRERGHLAADILSRTLRGEIKPATHVAKRPMIANIMKQGTSQGPMAELMSYARDFERRPGIISISVMGGFQYADVPWIGPSIIAVANGSRGLAEDVAESLADRLWARRSEFQTDLPQVPEAVKIAIQKEGGPHLLIDLGDNIGGGSAGDSTFILEELLNQRAEEFLIVLYDPSAVKECSRIGINGRFKGMVGAKVDGLHGRPVPIEGTVMRLHDGHWVETEARHGGRRDNDQGPTAVIRTDDGSAIVVNSLRTPPFSLGQITSVGLRVADYHIIVVKAAIAYKAAYLPVSQSIIEVDTPGITTMNPRHFTYRNIPRPMYPLD